MAGSFQLFNSPIFPVMSATTDPESSPVGENLEASKEHAVQAAEELRAAASQKVHDLRDAAVERGEEIKDRAQQRASEFRDQATEKTEHLREYAEDQWSEARSQFDDLKEEGELYVRKNPAKAVLLALGLGFVIGRILR
jgi:ElaB/YqjD/DUF883 family membrane-anchored ribosome-binding protein